MVVGARVPVPCKDIPHWRLENGSTSNVRWVNIINPILKRRITLDQALRSSAIFEQIKVESHKNRGG